MWSTQEDKKKRHTIRSFRSPSFRSIGFPEPLANKEQEEPVGRDQAIATAFTVQRSLEKWTSLAIPKSRRLLSTKQFYNSSHWAPLT